MPRSAEIRTFFSTAAERHQRVLVGAIPVGALIVFEIEGGGTWTVHNDRGRVRVVPEAEDVVDCRLTCSADDLHALLEGRLDAREAFMGGRVRIEGDVGLIQRLNKAFARQRGRR